MSEQRVEPTSPTDSFDLIKLQRAYLVEGCRRALAPWQEFELTALIANGHGACALLRAYGEPEQELVSFEERARQRELEQQVQLGETATEVFFYGNLPLVKAQAKFVLGSPYCRKVSMDDLLIVGREELLRSIQDFDPSRGFKFSTHAVRRIRWKMLRWAKDNGATIRVPVSHRESLALFKGYLKKGKTPHEAAKFVKRELETLQDIDEALNKYRDAGDSEILEYYADQATSAGVDEVATDNLEKKELITAVRQVLKDAARLNNGGRNSSYAADQERSFRILMEWFGYGLTLTEIAQREDVAKQRIHQIIARALRTLGTELPESARVRAQELGYGDLDGGNGRAA